MVFGINVMFLLLLGFSYPHIEMGTGAHVVTLLTFGMVCVMLTLVSVLMYVNPENETV